MFLQDPAAIAVERVLPSGMGLASGISRRGRPSASAGWSVRRPQRSGHSVRPHRDGGWPRAPRRRSRRRADHAPQAGAGQRVHPRGRLPGTSTIAPIRSGGGWRAAPRSGGSTPLQTFSSVVLPAPSPDHRGDRSWGDRQVDLRQRGSSAEAHGDALQAPGHRSAPAIATPSAAPVVGLPGTGSRSRRTRTMLRANTATARAASARGNPRSDHVAARSITPRAISTNQVSGSSGQR